MENNSNILWRREKCSKCRNESGILMSSHRILGGLCDHSFCQSCFKKENMNFASGLAHAITCPCCHIPFYENTKSIDEAILIGEAATLFNHIPPHLLSTDVVIGAEERLRINQINKVVTDS